MALVQFNFLGNEEYIFPDFLILFSAVLILLKLLFIKYSEYFFNLEFSNSCFESKSL